MESMWNNMYGDVCYAFNATLPQYKITIINKIPVLFDELIKSRYTTSDVQQSIQHVKSLVFIEFVCEAVVFKIYIFKHRLLWSPDNIKQLIHLVCYYVRLLRKIKGRTSNKTVCNIGLFLLTRTKKLPRKGAIIGTEHINSGVAYNGTIFIFRKEEFAKVLLHELLHALNYDYPAVNQINPQSHMIKIQTYEVPLRLNETYVELMTSIIHVTTLCVFSQSNVLSKPRFIQVCCHYYMSMLNHFDMNIGKVIVHCGYEKNNRMPFILKQYTHVAEYIIYKAVLAHSLQLCSILILQDTKLNATLLATIIVKALNELNWISYFDMCIKVFKTTSRTRNITMMHDDLKWR